MQLKKQIDIISFETIISPYSNCNIWYYSNYLIFHCLKYNVGLLFYTLVLDEKKEAQVGQGHQEDISVVTELKVSSRNYLVKSLRKGVLKWGERRNQRQNIALLKDFLFCFVFSFLKLGFLEWEGESGCFYIDQCYFKTLVNWA